MESGAVERQRSRFGGSAVWWPMQSGRNLRLPRSAQNVAGGGLGREDQSGSARYPGTGGSSPRADDRTAR